jgi:hypothetical protein
MGVIADRVIELGQKLKYIQNIAREINTSNLQTDLENKIVEVFDTIKPFSHRYVTINDVTISVYGWRYQVTVGPWLSMKYIGYRATPIYDKKEFVEVIREHGDKISEYVRRPIKDTFKQLVDLTKQVKPYQTLKFTKRVDKDVKVGYLCELETIHINKIWIETSIPTYVYYDDGERHHLTHCFHIDSWNDIVPLEDLLDDLVDLYKTGKEELYPIKEHNDKIIAKMREAVLPFAVAKALKSGNKTFLEGWL